MTSTICLICSKKNWSKSLEPLLRKSKLFYSVMAENDFWSIEIYYFVHVFLYIKENQSITWYLVTFKKNVKKVLQSLLHRLIIDIKHNTYIELLNTDYTQWENVRLSYQNNEQYWVLCVYHSTLHFKRRRRIITFWIRVYK